MQIQYKAPRNWLQTLLQTEIAQGMALTLRRMFNRPITRQYPEEKPVVAAGFRGRHALVRDAETGEQLQVDTHDKAFRQRFARLSAEREAALRTSLAAAGADTLELRTDDDLIDALLRFMDLRQRRAGPRLRAVQSSPRPTTVLAGQTAQATA